MARQGKEGGGRAHHAELAPFAEFRDGVVASDGALRGDVSHFVAHRRGVGVTYIVIGTIAVHCVDRWYMEGFSCQEVEMS